MRIRAASVRGIQHQAEHTARQDAFALAQVGGSQAIAVVCDGVGSLDRSDHAAAMVSQRLAQLAMSGMPWLAAFETANAELGKIVAEWEALRSGQHGDNRHRAHRDPAGRVVARRGSLGGRLAAVAPAHRWRLGACHGGASGGGQGFHSSAVQPMPTPDGACSWCSFRIYGGALFAMSDGVGNPLAWSAEVRHALASWWARPPDLLTFAAQVGFARKSHIDDRTVVGIWPDGE